MPFYYKSHGKEAPNKFVAAVRRIYNPLGFQRGYNFPLWIIFGLGALGFCASRAMYLDYDHTYRDSKWATGDWETQSHGRSRVGMLMHIACVVPIGFLLPFQFLPVVRHKFMLYHRLAGYVLMLLLLAGNAGAIAVSDTAMGASLEMRLFVPVVAGITTVSLALAYINIKRLQIDQHRAWMLRTWVYAFIIVSQRLIQLPTMQIISRMGIFYVPMKCHSIDHILTLVQPGLAPLFYPECAESPDNVVAVLANRNPVPNEQGIPPLHQIGATVQLTLLPTLILALLLHIFGIEMYLHLTGAEAKRLRRVSRERQRAKGWSRPGNASWLTKETWGDMGDESDEGEEIQEKAVNGALQQSDSSHSDAAPRHGTAADKTGV
jgi:hypothetical protein